MTNVLFSSKRVLDFLKANQPTKTLNPDELVLVGFQECYALRTGCLLYIIMTVLYWFEILVSRAVRHTDARGSCVVEGLVSIIVYSIMCGLCGWYVLLSLGCRALCVGRECGSGVWWDLRSTIANPFSEYGLRVVPTVGTRRGALVDDGLLLLTNVPITRRPFKLVRFTKARGYGFQIGQIELNHQHYLVVHAHLQDLSCCGDRTAYKDQVTQLINHIKYEQEMNPSMTTIVLGDLNSAAEEMERIKDSLKLVSCAEDSGILMEATTQESRTVYITKENPFSDHPMFMYTTRPRVF